MRRRRGQKRRWPVGLVVVATALAGVGAVGTAHGDPAAAGQAATACTTSAVLGTWPLARLADETIVVPVDETDVAAAAPAAAAGYGGLLLFGSAAPADLGTQLAALRHDVPGGLGLLVMTDEEGGGVQRMPNLVGSMPWAAQMGATMSPAQIEKLAASVGTAMAANGVDVDLAPVLDVDGRAVEPGATDPDGYRSFSGTTSVVTADGVAFLRGMEAGGVLPVVKHFPGLGGVSGNTDDGPAHTLPWSTLQQVALPPFEAAVAAGVPAVMVANATVPGLTDVPASLSPTVVTGELRDRLGFGGLILTDSLSAGAIAAPPESLTVPAAAVAALRAGEDMVLYGLSTPSQDLAEAAATSAAIVDAVHTGTLPTATLVGAAAHVLAAEHVDLCRPTAGYWLASSGGNVHGVGNATWYGSEIGHDPGRVVGLASSLDGRGYWLVDADGVVRAFGDAGSLGWRPTGGADGTAVGLATTPDGRGYWVATTTGRILNLGDARFYGSDARTHLTSPVVGVAATPDGHGYWLVTAAGTVQPFGDAGSVGPSGTYRQSTPVVGLAAD